MVKVHKITASPYAANAYLVEAEQPVLVDVGIDPDFALNTIKRVIDPGSLEYIILTHCHYDHTAGTAQLAEQTNASVAIHQCDADLLDDIHATASSLFGARPPNIKPDMLLQGEEILDLGDLTLKVVHTPGHTPGGICLHSEDDPKVSSLKNIPAEYFSSLFSGDTVFSNGGIGRTDLPGGNSTALVNSIKLLTTLDIDVIYPGHGEAVYKNGSVHIEKSLKFAELNMLNK